MLSRRSLLWGVPALAGCGVQIPALPTAQPSATSLSSAVPAERVTLHDLHLSLRLPSGQPMTRDSRSDLPVYSSPQTRWQAYALAPSMPAHTEAINGSHGSYHEASEVRDATRLASFQVPGASVEVVSHIYSEYTNSRTDFTDYLAFILWATPPEPDQPVAVLARYRTTRGADESAELIDVARTVERAE